MNEMALYEPFSQYIVSAGVSSYGRAFGYQAILRFPNRYGASIIQGRFAYTTNTSEYELAIVEFDDQGAMSFARDTELGDYILGHLSLEKTYQVLNLIKDLPPRVNLLES